MTSGASSPRSGMPWSGDLIALAEAQLGPPPCRTAGSRWARGQLGRRSRPQDPPSSSTTACSPTSCAGSRHWPAGDRRPRHLRLPPLPGRHHGHQPPVAPAAHAVAAPVLVVDVQARPRRGPGRQHLLRLRPVTVTPACTHSSSSTSWRHPRGQSVFLAHDEHATATSRRWGSSAGLVLRRRVTTDTLDIKRGGVGAVVELARVPPCRSAARR